MKECSVHGCSNIAITKGWCDKHRKRFERHGHILDTRPAEWGSKASHPLYRTWERMVRFHSVKGSVCKEWSNDFWKFVSEVGDRPDKEYVLIRKNNEEPYGSDNCRWKKCFVKKTPEQQAYSKEYMAEWFRKRRASDPEFQFKSSLKRHYGITLEDYYEMYENQNGVCAICKGNEITVDKRTKKVRRLSVDHCHDTGKIRGLLCTGCNTGIGCLQHSIQHLQSAIDYLTLNERK